MSLYVDDDRSRARSRSRDRRTRDDDTRESSYVYPEDDLDDRYRSSGRRAEAPSSSSRSGGGGGLPYPADGGIDQMLPPGGYGYDAQKPIYRTASPSGRGRVPAPEQPPGAFPSDEPGPLVRYAEPKGDGRSSDDDRFKFLPQKYSSSKPAGDKDDRYRDSRDYRDSGRDPRDYDARDRRDRDDEDKFSRFLPQKYTSRRDDDSKLSDREKEKLARKQAKKERDEEDLAYGKPAGPSKSSRADEKKPSTYGSYVPDPRGRDPYAAPDPRSSGTNVLTVDPSARDRDRSRDRRRDASPNPMVAASSSLTVDGSSRDRDRSRDRRRDASPQPPSARMSSLSVSGARPTNLSLAAAPGSPLLESYHGTYQAMSPMPSPLLLASGHHHTVDVEPISPIGSDFESPDGKRRSRRARFQDPEDNATRLAKALKGDGPPDREPLVEILPSLTHEQVMELRHQYKALVKTGSQRKGVNIAKHIRSRLKDDNPNLMKACYAVALGRWESESYWANFWYQGDKTRRELLIESLMGRTNDEIRQIRDAFTDKKYDNSLTKCMRTELKEDKFKKAVLLVLEERRMEDFDRHGQPLRLDYKLVDQDVDDLRKAVKSEKGGESQMIQIVVSRSDAHLQEVLKEYERAYRANFARDSLKKSGNLIGELLAHILNGVINRPVRDALLLHHAITTSRKDELRHELLTSRLVRIHWDAAHMSAVRKAYRERYGVELLEAVRGATSGLWGTFCEELCIARVPHDIRTFQKVAFSSGR